ncbi:MAG: LacI family DNA-binding transcriptional regulator [Kiritimatiellales bacterium]|nr:LacI family DNA-binding transcriptional regulator [Kiritimatiellales bacterium]
MATLYDVCKKTGLSSATVSRVINGSSLVKKATRDRVQKAMEELNYRPSHAARMLAGSKTDTIGVVLPAIDNGYYVQVLHGLDHVSTTEKLKLLISFYHSDLDLLDNLGSLCGEGRADAVILMNNSLLPPEKVRELTGDDFPIVLIGQKDETAKAADSILIDNVHGAHCAVAHLLENQPKSLLLITGPENNFDSQERLLGAQKAIEEAPFDVEVSILHSDFRYEGGRKVFAEYIKEHGTYPDAVFSFNDDMALGVLDVLNGSDRKIPEDIQIIGFDNNLLARCIGLSTISVPMRQIGVEAGLLVANRIKNKDAKPASITLQTSLIPRKTTRQKIG